MASDSSERRFGISRMVRNTTPPEEMVAKILEARSKSEAKNEPPAPKTIIRTLTDEKLDHLSDGLGQLFDLVAAVHEQHAARDKAFDLLYEELGDYKNDFFYERLKPLMRSLLFLLDSIEEFKEELDNHEKLGSTMSHGSIRANSDHFRDQLIDALHLVEMSMLEPETNEFDPKTQRAIEVVKVEPEQNNTVQRQIRSGWTLGGKILRPADVLVGKA